MPCKFHRSTPKPFVNMNRGRNWSGRLNIEPAQISITQFGLSGHESQVRYGM
ncbi:hypothetical protein AVEN_90737-1, partial [Araneus ventricosus]